jgi:hypothetical protein
METKKYLEVVMTEGMEPETPAMEEGESAGSDEQAKEGE